MSISIDRFWDLATESGLLTREICAKSAERWAAMKGASTSGSARTMAEWLVAEGTITRYQATVLLADHAGPFLFEGYRVTDRIPKGRFAGLFRATHVATGHPVFLNFFRGSVAEEPSRWSAAVGAMVQMAALVHPNLCRWHDIVADGAYRFAVLEPLAGESLRRMLAGNRRIGPEEACRMISLAACGLDHLHAHHRIHGEVRPSNVWVAPDGNVCLLTGPLTHQLDEPPGRFDLAVADSDKRMSAAIDYLAPELARRNVQPTPAGDQYALGCVLYQMLSGHPPFPASGAAERVHLHATANVAPISAPRISLDLQKVLATMLAKDAGLRFPHLNAVAEELRALAPRETVVSRSEDVPARGAGTLEAFTAAIGTAGRHAPPPSTSTPTEARPSGETHEPIVVNQPSDPDAPRNRSSDPDAPRNRSSDPDAPRNHSSDPDAPRNHSSDPDAPRNHSSDPDAPSVRVANGPLHSLAADVGPGIQIETRSESSQALRHSARRWPKFALICGIVLALASGTTYLAGLWLNNSSDVPSTSPVSNVDAGDDTTLSARPMPNETTQAAPADTVDTVSVRHAAREVLVEDDGKLLWASPTAGPPIELAFLPPGCQLLLVLRPAAVAEHPQGERILASLGPWGDAAVEDLQTRCDLQLTQIDRLVVGMGGSNGSQELTSTYVVELIPGVSAASLAERHAGKSVAHGDATYFVEHDAAYFAPPGADDLVFVVAPADALLDIVEQGPGAPPLRREFERLLAAADADRHVTLLAAPSFLFADGRTLLSGPTQVLRKPLVWFLGENVQAVSLSFHWGEDFFAELRIAGTLDASPKALAKALHERLRAVPEAVEDHVVSLRPAPFGRRLTARLPAMLRKLANYTRSDREDEHAVLRAYLPLAAGHNLLMATELTLAETNGGETTVDAPPTKPESAGGVRQRLEKVTSLSFPRDTLETALKMLAEDAGIEIVLVGRDLQLDGITKNQSFALDERDQPARQILLTILRLANPDKTATGPADPKQKLIYVVKPRTAGEPEAVFVTTRAQAETRGDPIPDVFRLQN